MLRCPGPFPLCVAAALATAPAARAEVGVGAAVQGRPALSVQYAPGRDDAYHVLAGVGNDSALFQADYQRFVRPRSLNFGPLRAAPYAGLGVTGEARRDAVPGERWFLHLPLGVQADVESLHFSTFAEAAAKIGALPGTGLSSAVSGGIRAYF